MLSFNYDRLMKQAPFTISTIVEDPVARNFQYILFSLVLC